MAKTIAVVVVLLMIAEGALLALAPSWIKRLLEDAAPRALVIAGVIEILLGLCLLSLLAARP